MPLPDPGLVLHIPMREGAGPTAYDASRWNNNGAINGGVEWVEHGMRFDGSTGYLNCGNDASLNITDAMTVSVIFNTDVHGDQIISKHNVTGPFFLQTAGNTDLRFMTYTSVGRVDHYVSFAYKGGWHHIVGVYDSTIGKSNIYVDGNQVGAGVAQTGLLNVTTSKVFVGTYGESTGIGNYFEGSISDVRIHNRALSAAEIKRQYKREVHNYV